MEPKKVRAAVPLLTILVILFVHALSAIATHSDIARMCSSKGEFTLFIGKTISCSIKPEQE